MSVRDPISLGPNLVTRFYRGGGRLAAFRAAAGHEVPGHACEDWVGSATAAWRPPGAEPGDEGLSRLPDGRLLAELLGAEPEELVGRRHLDALGTTTGLLVKLLDAGQRLPVHCHPTRSFASAHLGSRFGKAEAWIVVETYPVPGAEPPGIRLGFRDGVDRDVLLRWIVEQDTGALLDAMPSRPVAPGDVWFVPPGIPHAIGAGVFIVEVQEPTDFSIVAEVRGFPIDAANASLRRGWDLMVDAFDRSPMDEARLESLRQPRSAADGLAAAPLLVGAAEEFFRASRLTVGSEAGWPYPDCYAVVVVLRGAGAVRGPSGALDVRRGSTFAVPAAGAAETTVVANEPLELVVCRPPELGPAPA